jgi:hypothetical protein
MNDVLYVLSRCKSKTGIERYNTTHFGTEHETLCGKKVNEMWWIETDNIPVTCRKCISKYCEP